MVKEMIIQKIFNNFSNILKLINEKYPYIKYKTPIMLACLIVLFTLLKYSSIIFILTLEILMVFSLFILLTKIYDKKETLKCEDFNKIKIIFSAYICLPVILLTFILLKLGSNFTFWLLSLMLFNKIVGYTSDDVLNISILSRKVYKNRTLFSIINCSFFSFIIGCIGSVVLKQNFIIFSLFSFLLTISMFVEEFIFDRLQIRYNFSLSDNNLLSNLNGLLIPLLVINLTYFLYI